jgi:hypothetical protein
MKPAYLAAGAIGAVAILLFLKDRSDAKAAVVAPPSNDPRNPPSPLPSPTPNLPNPTAILEAGKRYKASDAVDVMLSEAGGEVDVLVGQSLRATKIPQGDLWSVPVMSSNTGVLAPSNPGTTNGFVVAGPGTAILTGYYYDQASSTPRAVSVKANASYATGAIPS